MVLVDVVVFILILGIAIIMGTLATIGPIPYTEKQIEKAVGDADIEEYDDLEEYMEYKYMDEDLSHIKLGVEKSERRSDEEKNKGNELEFGDLMIKF